MMFDGGVSEKLKLWGSTYYTDTPTELLLGRYFVGACTSRSPLFYIKSQISMAFTEVSEKLWGYSCAHPK